MNDTKVLVLQEREREMNLYEYFSIIYIYMNTLVSFIYMQRCLLNSLHELWLLTAKLCPIFSLSLAFASTRSLSTCKQARITVKKACYFNTGRSHTLCTSHAAQHTDHEIAMRDTSTCHTYIYATLSTTLAVRFFSYSIHLLHELTWEWIPPVRHAAQYTN